jgi:hypothetical protein
MLLLFRIPNAAFQRAEFKESVRDEISPHAELVEA